MTNKIDDGGPAFPCNSNNPYSPVTGMSLRDWLAGQALQVVGQAPAAANIAESAYEIADAMVARGKSQTDVATDSDRG